MARRKKQSVDVEVEMNMTPMIDIVFQMILFFIIITDFTQHDIALLELPWSQAGEDDEGDDPKRVIINITAPLPPPGERSDMPAQVLRKADKILVRDKEYDFESLARFLEQKGKEYYPDPENPALSETSVLIRCDGKQAFDYVKAILQICAQPKVAIYKIEIATAEKAE